MATVLDVGLFDQVSVIFTWLLVFIIMFGFLEAVNPLKNRAIHATLAFVIAIFAGFSNITTGFISTMLPWFFVIALFVFFVFLIGNFMGISSPAIVESLGGQNAIWWILVLGFFIVAGSLSAVFGQDLLEERDTDDSSSQKTSAVLTFTNPKILGFGLLIIISAFTIVFLTAGGKGIA